MSAGTASAATGPIRPKAPAALRRTHSSLSLRAVISTGTASAAGPICPSAQVALRRTHLSPPSRAVTSAGNADGPICPSAQVALRRTGTSPSLRAVISAGTASAATGPIRPKAPAAELRRLRLPGDAPLPAARRRSGRGLKLSRGRGSRPSAHPTGTPRAHLDPDHAPTPDLARRLPRCPCCQTPHSEQVLLIQPLLLSA
jgi:hypothetical protein